MLNLVQLFIPVCCNASQTILGIRKRIFFFLSLVPAHGRFMRVHVVAFYTARNQTVRTYRKSSCTLPWSTTTLVCNGVFFGTQCRWSRPTGIWSRWKKPRPKADRKMRFANLTIKQKHRTIWLHLISTGNSRRTLIIWTIGVEKQFVR